MDIETCIKKLGYVGVPFKILENCCLQCGNCFENCPVSAIKSY